MSAAETELDLSIIITVVSGAGAMRCHLERLCPQVNFDTGEVIVPFDKWSRDVGALAAEFPNVNFYFIEDQYADVAECARPNDHRLYDKRRAVGLRLSRGKIVAMTEDHGLPAEDWVEQILAAHEQPFEVIGGAVENGIDRPLNRALYYCDFGRYGRPIRETGNSYLSDVNIAYKRTALAATKDLWWDAYQETTVNWALQSLGRKLHLDDRPVVYQCRPRLGFGKVLKERLHWGRVFAGTRAKQLGYGRRVLFATGTAFLPPILLARALRNMSRQGQSFGKILITLPLISVLTVFWSIGELIGYIVSGSKYYGHRFTGATVEDAGSRAA